MSSKRNPDPSNIETWLVSVLEFDGDWAMPRVPDLVKRGMSEGLRLSDVKDLLLRWLLDHSGHVAPVLTSIRMIEFFHQPKRYYLRTRSGAYASHIRVHRGLLDRLPKEATSRDPRYWWLRDTIVGEFVSDTIPDAKTPPGDLTAPIHQKGSYLARVFCYKC